MEILKTINLKKIYGSGETQVEAVRDVNISINKGEMVAIMGPSGCGKSTLMHILAGVDSPTSGDVYVEDRKISGLNDRELALYRRRKVGIIYQFFNLIPNLSIENNIKIPVLLDNKEVDEEYFNEIVNLLGIKDKLKTFPSKLSGGQQQRVSIGRSVIYKPAIILADEPTGNLDRGNAREIVELFKMSNIKYNQTILIVTHDEEVALSCNRIIKMEDGLIISDEVVR